MTRDEHTFSDELIDQALANVAFPATSDISRSVLRRITVGTPTNEHSAIDDPSAFGLNGPVDEPWSPPSPTPQLPTATSDLVLEPDRRLQLAEIGFIAAAAIVILISIAVWQSSLFGVGDGESSPSLGSSGPGELSNWLNTDDAVTGMIDEATLPRPGSLAADFALVREDGSVLQLSDLRGQPVFLNFWASWCPYCVAEMPDFERISREFDGRLTVLGVNNGESVQVGADFAREVDANYELVYDPDQDVIDGYRVQVMPMTYLIDADGIIVDVQFGFLDYDEMIEKLAAVLDLGNSS